MDISGLRHSDRIPPAAPLTGEASIGELLGDAAVHAQGIIRAEVRLGLAQLRTEVRHVLRRMALFGGALGLAFASAVALLIAGALALDTRLPLWLAVLATAGIALVFALVLFGLARRGTP